MSNHLNRVAEEFGNIDIYVFDQLLRGHIAPGMTVLDCGCGGGRNLIYLMRNGYDVRGVDQDPRAIHAIRALARDVAPQLDPENFRADPVESMSFDDASADAVLSSAVLHFARDAQHFHAMVREMWRVLRPGGMMFCRLASTIGMENRFENIQERTFRLLDGSVRFLVDAELLLDTTAQIGGTLIDPIKTTVVHEQRCMTTWVVRKSQSRA